MSAHTGGTETESVRRMCTIHTPTPTPLAINDTQGACWRQLHMSRYIHTHTPDEVAQEVGVRAHTTNVSFVALDTLRGALLRSLKYHVRNSV